MQSSTHGSLHTLYPTPRGAHTCPWPPTRVPLRPELPFGNKSSLIKLQCKFKQIEVAWIQMNYSNQLFITLLPGWFPRLDSAQPGGTLGKKIATCLHFMEMMEPSARSFPLSYNSPSLCLHFHVGWGRRSGVSGMLQGPPQPGQEGGPGVTPEHHPRASPQRRWLFLTVEVSLRRKLRSLE